MLRRDPCGSKREPGGDDIGSLQTDFADLIVAGFIECAEIGGHQAVGPESAEQRAAIVQPSEGEIVGEVG